MGRKIKVFAGNYNGREGRAVATYTKKRASELLSVSLHTMGQFFGERPSEHYPDCIENPEKVYSFSLNDYKIPHTLKKVDTP